MRTARPSKLRPLRICRIIPEINLSWNPMFFISSNFVRYRFVGSLFKAPASRAGKFLGVRNNLKCSGVTSISLATGTLVSTEESLFSSSSWEARIWALHVSILAVASSRLLRFLQKKFDTLNTEKVNRRGHPIFYIYSPKYAYSSRH